MRPKPQERHPVRDHRLDPLRHDPLHPAPGRLPLRAAGEAIGETWDEAGPGLYTTFTGPFAEIATLLRIGWLAAIIYVDAIICPAGTGLIYITGSSRLHTACPQRLRPVALRVDQQAWCPVGRPDRRLRHRLHLLPAVPELAVAGRPDHQRVVLMYAGAPLSLGAFRRRLPDADWPYLLPAASILAPLGFDDLRPDHPLVGLGHLALTIFAVSYGAYSMAALDYRSLINDLGAQYYLSKITSEGAVPLVDFQHGWNAGSWWARRVALPDGRRRPHPLGVPLESTVRRMSRGGPRRRDRAEAEAASGSDGHDGARSPDLVSPGT